MRPTSLLWIVLICLTIIGSISIVSLDRRSQAASTTRWEYKLTHIQLNFQQGSRVEPERTLNELGAEGWELVQIMSPDQTANVGGYFLLKRSK
jgi:hypothetical protein